MAKNVTSRRRVLKGGLAAAGLGLFGLPEWAMPALAQGETLVPFTDYPANFATNPSEVVRVLDIRTIAGALTPKDQFFTTQHYGHPTIDAAAFRLKISGLVERPKSFSLDDLKAMGKDDVVAGFECSGNGRGRIQGFASNGRFTGVPLRKVLKEAGLKNDGHEVVFFGADHGEEETEFRAAEDQAGPGVRPEHAARTGARLRSAGGLRDERRTADETPGRAAAPHHAGLVRRRERQVALAHSRAARSLHGQVPVALVPDDARGEDRRGDGVERDRRHAHAPQIRRRARGEGGERPRHHGFRAQRRNAGEVGRSEDRQRPVAGRARSITRTASSRGSCSRYTWKGATPGEHTIVSRATDAYGYVQPETAELASKKTFLEDNSQFPRKVMVA